MKHLLIILLILLLPSPLFGQSKETSVLYKWKSGSRWVWKSFGVDGIHTKYMGEIKNGKPDGRGIKLKPYAGKYFGEWKNGKEHGQGTETSPDGNSYEGEWKDGKQNGQGKWTLPNGYQYVGEWKDGIEWRVTIYDKDGKIDGTVWIGVRQFSSP